MVWIIGKRFWRTGLKNEYSFKDNNLDDRHITVFCRTNDHLAEQQDKGLHAIRM